MDEKKIFLLCGKNNFVLIEVICGQKKLKNDFFRFSHGNAHFYL